MVANAMINAIIPEAAKIHQLTSMRDANPPSHLFIAYKATGIARAAAINTNIKKSFDNSFTICGMLAPNTLRTPISLTRCDMVNADKPNKPKQAMNMAMQANMENRVPCCCSLWYSWSKRWSRNVKSKGVLGKYFCQVFWIVAMDDCTFRPSIFIDRRL